VGALECSAEGIYRAKNLDSGFYCFAGLGYTAAWLMVDYSDPDESFPLEVEAAGGLTFSAGVGFDFIRNIGIEARYVMPVGLKFSGLPQNANYSYFQVGARFRF
jgi:hypothetical protein